MTETGVELPLRGAGGEPVDLWRTINSHGLVDLPPMRIDQDARSLDVTLALPGGARTLTIGSGRPGHASVQAAGPRPGKRATGEIVAAAAHVLRLDDDLSGLYALVSDDSDLAWAAVGAGRLVRSPTVFEDVVKTICTTNCAWSATERMVGALVASLGATAPGGRQAFPTPEAMADAGDDFYRDVVRAGYRGRYLQDLADAVAGGRARPRAARTTPAIADDEVERRLLALPGVGPVRGGARDDDARTLLAARARLVDTPEVRAAHRTQDVKDTTIARRFRRYGRFAGLAFWLFLTRDWVDDSPGELA